MPAQDLRDSNRPMQSHPQVLGIDRLQHIVEGAAPHRIHGQRDRVHPRHHQHRQVWVDLLNAADEIQPIHSRQHHVGQHKIDGPFPEQLQGPFCRGTNLHIEISPEWFQIRRFKGVQHQFNIRCVVLDDQDRERRFGFGFGRSHVGHSATCHHHLPLPHRTPGRTTSTTSGNLDADILGFEAPSRS